MSLERLTAPDTWELVSPAIASILAAELARQSALDVAAGDPPFPVYVYEGVLRNLEDVVEGAQGGDLTPIVQVLDGALSSPGKGSDRVTSQNHGWTTTVHAFTFGLDGADGTTATDRATATAKILARKIRRILMAPSNLSLGLPRRVTGRYVSRIAISPIHEAGTTPAIVHTEIGVDVDLVETPPGESYETLEGFRVSCKRSSDGRILVEMEI